MYVYTSYSSEFLVTVVHMDIYTNDLTVSKIYWTLIV